MAKGRKGCLNDDCIAKKKKMLFRLENDYCPRCGQSLYYVCRRCGMKLPDGEKKYCVRCENELKDKKDSPGKTILESVASGAKAAGGFVVDAGQKAIKATGDIASGIKEGTGKIIEKAKDSKKNKDE